MAMGLMNLIGQAIAAQTGEGLPEEEEEWAGDPFAPITVQGKLPYDPRMNPERPTFGEPAARPGITPEYILNDNRMRPSPEELENPDLGFKGTGVFKGAKGSLRHILGTLGDAFLIQGGADPRYAPQREKEKAAEALYGLTKDPIQAIERLNAVGQPEAASKMFDDQQTQGVRRDTLMSQEAARRDLSQDRRFTNIGQAQTQLQRILANAANPPQRQRLAAYYGPLLAERAGVTPADLGLIEGMTDEDLDAFARGDMTVNQTVALPRRDRQLDISQQNADANTRNSNRPRASSRPRADTELEYYRELSDVPVEDRTKEETDFMKKFIKGTKGGGLLDGITAPSGKKPTSRFRPVR